MFPTTASLSVGWKKQPVGPVVCASREQSVDDGWRKPPFAVLVSPVALTPKKDARTAPSPLIEGEISNFYSSSQATPAQQMSKCRSKNGQLV